MNKKEIVVIKIFDSKDRVAVFQSRDRDQLATGVFPTPVGLLLKPVRAAVEEDDVRRT